MISFVRDLCGSVGIQRYIALLTITPGVRGGAMELGSRWVGVFILNFSFGVNLFGNRLSQHAFMQHTLTPYHQHTHTHMVKVTKTSFRTPDRALISPTRF